MSGYELHGELGRGGMGVVHLARNIPLNRPCALKTFSAGGGCPTAAARLRGEAETVAQLRHPNVVQIYGVGEVSGVPFLELEYLPGGSLADGPAGSPRSAIDAARLIEPVARAVAEAHRLGIVHRDLKPANVLLTAEGTPKVSDFGLARSLGSDVRLTHTGQVVGTPSYMAPEQTVAGAIGVGPAADVYSLGAILYELLTGHPPFRAATALQTLDLVRSQDPVPPRQMQPTVPQDLETVCLKCLEKEPEKRYATAEALADDLGRFLNHKPITARPVGFIGRLMRWRRRNPVAAGLLGALAATGGAAFVAVLGEWQKAEQARQEANAFAKSEAKQRFKAVDAQERAERAGDEARRRGEAERWERYRSNIGAAAAALQLQNSSTARRALEAAPPEHRDWEWRHLHSQLDNARDVLPWITPTSGSWAWWEQPIVCPSGKQVATLDRDGRAIYLWDPITGAAAGVLRGHKAPVNALVYTLDGKHLASGSNDTTVRLWDPATAKAVATLEGHKKPVEWLVYAPDGQRILSLAERCGRLWDTSTGRTLAVLGGPIKPRNAAFTPDSQRLVIAVENRVYVLDATSGQQIAELGRHVHHVIQVVVSPDGKRIASHGDHEKTIRLWDAATCHEVAVLRGDVEFPGALVFSADGSRLVSGSVYPDNTVRLWDAATGRLIGTMEGHKNTITSVAFAPNGRRLVSASLNPTAWLWDGVTGQSIAPLRGHTESVSNAIFSPDGKRVVTASADQTLRLWEAASGNLIAVLRGHHAPVKGVAFAAQGSLLVSRSADGESRVWDMELAERNGILLGHESFVYDVAFSPDGSHVASAAWDGTARLWDVTTGRQTALLRHSPENADIAIVTSVAWHPSGNRLATVARGDTITVWDVVTAKADQVFHTPTGAWNGDARAVFNPTGTLLASGSRDGLVRLWDVATGEPAGVLEGHRGLALDVAFNPDGDQLASVGYDGTVRLWNVATRTPIKTLLGDAEGYRIAYSPDGRLVAASAMGGNVRLWDARTYRELAVLPHGTRVLGLAFDREGTRLATGCGDHTIRLWDVATGQEVCELRGHEAYVHALAFSPDGTQLASASGDSTVRIWDTVLPAMRSHPRNTFLSPHAGTPRIDRVPAPVQDRQPIW